MSNETPLLSFWAWQGCFLVEFSFCYFIYNPQSCFITTLSGYNTQIFEFFQAQATTDLIFPYREGWWYVVHDFGVIGADKLRVDDAACGAVNNVAINFAVPIYCCVGS